MSGPHFIAHRAGNDPQAVTEWAEHADLIEVDVHRWKRRLEVRHAKRAWPTSRLWERSGLLPAATEVHGFDAVLDAAARAGTHLWLDAKGIDPRLHRAVAAATDAIRPLTVSTKAWWLLGPFSRRRAEGVRTFRSVGNRLELWALLRLPSRVALDGVVLHERLLHRSLVQRLRARGWEIVSWAVTDRTRAEELLGWGVAGLILDERELLVELRRDHGRAARPAVDADLGPGDADLGPGPGPTAGAPLEGPPVPAPPTVGEGEPTYRGV